VEITSIVSAILIGIGIGALGRLVVPGRQRLGLLLTMLIGIVAALVGTLAAGALGVANTDGVDWVELAMQIGLAGIGVAALDGGRFGHRRPLRHKAYHRG
jgi:uncharacterized membrane protein YeaQ/YmgE (transglycosylase-associated protein family)